MLENSDNKKNPFKVPENYFENFNQNMMNNLPAQKQAKKVSLWKKVLPWTAVAAAFAGIVFSVGILRNDTPSAITSKNPVETTIVSGDGTTEEDDFFLFIEDQSTQAAYDDVVFSEL